MWVRVSPREAHEPPISGSHKYANQDVPLDIQISRPIPDTGNPDVNQLPEAILRKFELRMRSNVCQWVKNVPPTAHLQAYPDSKAVHLPRPLGLRITHNIPFPNMSRITQKGPTHSTQDY